MIRKTTRTTLPEYDSLVRKGVFDDIVGKIELIRGAVVEVNPAGPVHDDYVTYLTNWSVMSRDASKTYVTSQTGMELPELDSRPEPDVFWVRKARYRSHHPLASDVQLAIEVADSSFENDLRVKRQMYAEAGVIEYWIVDCQSKCIHVFRNASGTDYQSHSVLNSPEKLSPLIASDAILDLQDLFDGE
jgi:Uma2 family endonuclease